jgi:hypothetical protein
MKTRADDAPQGKGWDESVLVWNATVARIPAPAVQPAAAEDVAEAEDGNATPNLRHGRPRGKCSKSP